MGGRGRGLRIAAAAVALGGVVVGAAGCTSGATPAPRTSSATTSAVAQPPAFPGLTAPQLIVPMKAAVGRGAVVTYSGKNSIGNPSGRGSYVVSPADHKESPGSYLIQTDVNSDKIVYMLVCTSQQKASGLTPILKVCTDLSIPGMDNAAMRAWVGDKRAHTSTIHRQFGPVSAGLTFTDSELDIVLAYGGKP